MNIRSSFFYKWTRSDDGVDVLTIIDKREDACMSVTNDMENVLRHIEEQGPLPEKIIYQDSDQLWSRVKINAPGDISFSPSAPGHSGKCSRSEAVLLALKEEE